MKIKVELSEGMEEEIVIRCHSLDERIQRITARIEAELSTGKELKLLQGSMECYVDRNEILFFETDDNRVLAHTANEIYTAPYKLFELEALLHPAFARISKSVIANIYRIRALRRELSGSGEISFRDSDKKTYFSRGYYKPLHERIEEMRLLR